MSEHLDSINEVKEEKNGKSTTLTNIRITLKRALTATSFLSGWTVATYADDDSQKELKPTISHPLAGLSKSELNHKVYEFADQNGLVEHLETLQKGARVAQKGNDWYRIRDELTSTEIAALEHVKLHPWKQITRPLLITVAAASFGALTLGWDQSILSGATLFYPRDLNIDPDIKGPNQLLYNWLTGIVSAGPFLGAAGCSVWLSDSLNHYFGRRGALAIAAIFLLLSPLGSAFCQTWVQLLVCRILLGFGIGFLEVTAPVFAAESAPQEIRGAMTINFQLFTAFGIFLGATVNLIFEKVKYNWRYMIASPLVPVPILLLLLWFSPESARWYLKWGKVKPAFHSLQRLRNHDLLAARDLYLFHVQLVEEQNAIGGSVNLTRFAELFYKNRVRQATIASCVAHLAQVLSGVNIVCLFSATIFTELTMHWGTGGSTGNALTGQHAPSKTRALCGSWGFGLINFIFTFPAIWTIDKFGRRALMLATLPNLCWTLLGTALTFLRNDHSSNVELGLVLFFIYLFTAFYSSGMGPIAFCYSAESAPQTHRELSMALAAFVNNSINAILSIVFFRMREVFSTVGVFGFYSACNILTFFLVFAFVPETKKLSLEELDSVFAHSNSEFIKYQCTKRVPYLVKRYILRRKDVELKSLDEINHIDKLVA